MPARLHAWPRHVSLVDRLSQRDVIEVAAADVTDRREASHERLLGIGDAQDCAEAVEVAHASVVAARVTERATDDVRMCIDESGQQRSIAKVDPPRTSRYGNRSLAADC